MSSFLTVGSYRYYNESLSPALVFRMGGDAGFFSELNNMLLAQLYCLRHGIRFTLYSRYANFSGPVGWNDFFEPFCPETTNIFHRKYNQRDIGDSRVWTLYSQVRPWLGWPYLTQDLWPLLRVPETQSYSVPALGWRDLSMKEALHQLFDVVWRYNAATDGEVAHMKALVPLPDSYVGLHIRAGDKFVEHPLLAISEYMNKAESLTDIRHAFVLTDDYTVFEALCAQYPHWTFSTLCHISERGYFHRDFMKRSDQEIRFNHIKLFASSDILAQSDHFIGTFSSNPGMNMGIRMEPGRCHGIDFDSWRVW